MLITVFFDRMSLNIKIRIEGELHCRQIKFVTITFFLYTHLFLDPFHLKGIQAAFSTGYPRLPFVMLA